MADVWCSLPLMPVYLDDPDAGVEEKYSHHFTSPKDPFKGLIAKMTLDKMRQCLTIRQNKLIDVYLKNNCSMIETSTEMGEHYETVKTKVYYAMNKMRKFNEWNTASDI
jgi:hypothetical protein